MTCKSCNTRNPIGNKFCRECGAKLAPPANDLAVEEIARADAERTAERAGLLLSEAFALTEKGRPEAALPLAEEAAHLLPRSTRAHATLALLYEQTGELERAIAAMERVVSMNPESAADAHKLDRLKLAARGDAAAEATDADSAAAAVPEDSEAEDVEEAPTVERTPRPAAPKPMASPAVRKPQEREPRRPAAATWVPVAAAAGVAALVLGLGLGSMRAAGRQDRSAGNTQVASAADNATGAPAAPAGAGTSPSGAAGFELPKERDFTPPAVTREDPFVAAGNARRAAEAATNATPPASAPQPPARPAAANAGGNTLPALLGRIGGARPAPAAPPAPPRVAPAPVPAEIVDAARQSQQAGQQPSPSQGGGMITGGLPSVGGFGGGSRIAAGPPASGGDNGSAGTGGASTEPPAGGGYIKITVSPPRSAGSQGAPILASPPSQNGGSGAEDDGDPMRRAQKALGAGRYGEAAAASQEAINRGSDGGEAHQNLAMAQQRAGDDAAARASYRRAIAAYKAQVAAGRNVAAAQRGITSCEAALEVLGGG